MSKRICSYCGRIVATDHICDKKPKDNRKKQINVDSRWKRIRNDVKERDLCCQLCWREGIYHKIDEVHHIIPRDVATDDDHVFEANNCIGLCHDCHVKVHNDGWQKYSKLFKEMIDHE